jgi:hypothetical protein
MTVSKLLLFALAPVTVWAQSAPPATNPPWNPKPATGDLILPLPCGEGIVFRSIPTPVQPPSPLADIRVVLGDDQAPPKFAEAVRTAYVEGPFGSGNDAHYWLGKYEVTQGQYAAVFQDCAAHDALSPRDRGMPASKVTWFDTAAFSAKATEFIVKNRPDALPASDGAHAFLRLPTEAEWEYAARGAHADSDTFRLRLPPMDGPIAAYANLRRNGEARVQPVGSLQADHLGLYDMFGNVEEIMLDSYRTTLGGREGGRVGGILARGGSAEMNADTIYTSLRTEYAPFEADGKPFVDEFLGFRVALGLPVNTSVPAYANLLRAFEAEVSQAGRMLDRNSDPLQLARNLEAAADPAQKPALARIRAAVEEQRSQLAQADERAARNAIGAGAALIREYYNANIGVHGYEQVRQTLAKLDQASPGQQAVNQRLQEASASLAKWTQSRDTTFAVLASLVLQQLDVPQPTIEAQLQVWQRAYDSPEFEYLRGCARKFVVEIAAARRGHAVARDAAVARLQKDCLER